MLLDVGISQVVPGGAAPASSWRHPSGHLLEEVAEVKPGASGAPKAANRIKGGEKKEEPEEKEEGPSPVACAVSVMLMGTISFQMGLFYMVNHSDQDMRRCSWQVISNTISIFSAVLMFQAINKLVEQYIIGEENDISEFAVKVDIIHLCVWLVLLQSALFFASGSAHDKCRRCRKRNAAGVEKKVSLWQWWTGRKQPELEEVELNVKSWAVLFAHLTGFASINAWGSVQQTYLNDSWKHAMLAVPLGMTVLWFLIKIFDFVREKTAEVNHGRKDEYEDKWDEESEEAEDDVAGLSMSFLTVQAVRFYLTHRLPNQEGQEVAFGDVESLNLEGSHGNDWYKLVGMGFVMMLCSVISLYLKDGISEERENAKRFLGLLNVYFSCGNAWCFFYGSKWLLCSLHLTVETAVLHVVMAQVLSAIAFTIIYGLDTVRDTLEEIGVGSSAEDGIEAVIKTLGILVGFSWEQSFDVALDAVCESAKEKLPPNQLRLLLSIVLVGIVFPAWKLYILPTEMRLGEGGTIGERMASGEQYAHKFIDKNTPEADLDVAHLTLKRVRQNEVKKDILHDRAKASKPGKYRVEATKLLVWPEVEHGSGVDKSRLPVVEAGAEVHVTEVQVCERSLRVRGRLLEPRGWVALCSHEKWFLRSLEAHGEEEEEERRPRGMRMTHAKWKFKKSRKNFVLLPFGLRQVGCAHPENMLEAMLLHASHNKKNLEDDPDFDEDDRLVIRHAREHGLLHGGASSSTDGRAVRPAEKI